MRVIVVPTDFSNNALNALKCALQYFKYEKCRFIILHTYADEVYENDAVLTREILEEYKGIKRDASLKELKKVREAAITFAPNPHHTLETKAIFGTLLDIVNRLATSENADLIVMGTQGKTGDRNITFGSNTLQIIKYVTCPVLGIPIDYHITHLSRILFPSELMIPFKNRELKLVSCLAKSFRAEVHLLYISDIHKLSFRNEDVKGSWEYRFRESVTHYTHHPEGNIAQIINTYIAEHDISMLVMVNAKHTYLETLMETSTIDTIGLHIKIPFLILQNLPR